MTATKFKFSNISNISFEMIIAALFPQELVSDWYYGDYDDNGQGESLYEPGRFVTERNETGVPVKQVYSGTHPVYGELSFEWVATDWGHPKTASSNGYLVVTGEEARQGLATKIWNTVPFHNFGYYPESYERM